MRKIFLAILISGALSVAVEAVDFKVNVQLGNTACPYSYSFFNPHQPTVTASSPSASTAVYSSAPVFYSGTPLTYAYGVWYSSGGPIYVIPTLIPVYPSPCRSTLDLRRVILSIRWH